MTLAHPVSLGPYIEAKIINIAHEIIYKMYNEDPIQERNKFNH